MSLSLEGVPKGHRASRSPGHQGTTDNDIDEELRAWQCQATVGGQGPRKAAGKGGQNRRLKDVADTVAAVGCVG